MTKTDLNQKYAHWQKLVEEQQASGLSQKEFCKQRDLVLSQFVYYRCQLKNDSVVKEPGFTPVKIATQERATASSDIKLLLPNGFQCIFICEPLINQLQKNIVSSSYAQVDETRAQVLNEAGRDNRTKSYMWGYRSGGNQPSIVYEYQETRGGYH